MPFIIGTHTTTRQWYEHSTTQHLKNSNITLRMSTITTTTTLKATHKNMKTTTTRSQYDKVQDKVKQCQNRKDYHNKNKHQRQS